jgi:hypothetical protein
VFIKVEAMGKINRPTLRLKSALMVTFGVIVAGGLGTPLAVAQGCALCYQSAAAAGSRSIHALRNGIVVLMAPPFFICTGISYLVYRRRNLANRNN